ncbi:unnamed protein product [Cylicocyclus nassatus]|uniref:Uncharacterized protein n=1 Tax=Cylicocyclus nassatus TaxID=53992 RepID=A0AA36DN06_CYLNA|nr:unnamed protein product [Cylicocyclus nassatus]
MSYKLFILATVLLLHVCIATACFESLFGCVRSQDNNENEKPKKKKQYEQDLCRAKWTCSGVCRPHCGTVLYQVCLDNCIEAMMTKPSKQ